MELFLITAIFIGSIIFIALLPYLVRLSRSLFEKKYGKHLIFEHPLFTTPIITKISLWPRVIGALVAVAYIIYIMPTAAKYIPNNSLSFLAGFFLGISIFMLAQIAPHLFIYNYAAQHPNSMNGITHFKKPLVNTIILSNCLLVVGPIIILIAFIKSPFIFGIVCSALLWLGATLFAISK